MEKNPKQDTDAMKAKLDQQKKLAREPQETHGKDRPVAKPPESGKPLWDKPHSS
jgi:hypothetical protein